MYIAIDIETNVSGEVASPYTDAILCISAKTNDKEWISYDPLEFEDILESPDYVKIFHNGSFDLAFLLYHINKTRFCDLVVTNVWDTMIMERLLTSGMRQGCDLGLQF